MRLRLGEVKLRTRVRTIAFEIKSRQSLNNPNSVGEILLSEFYRQTGLAENFVVARIEQRLRRRGLLDALANAYEAEFGVAWRSAQGRDDLLTVRRRLAEVLPQVDPAEHGDRPSAKQALDDMFRHEKITAEGIADELVAWVEAQPATDGRVQPPGVRDRRDGGLHRRLDRAHRRAQTAWPRCSATRARAGSG